MSIDRTLVFALTAMWSAEVGSQEPPHDHALGSVHFPTSCSAAVQPELDRAVALLHHMTYPQARAAFERVATLDPQCAMAHWGIAMTLFQPLWPTRPSPEALQRGWDAVQTARALSPATERERLFIDAAGAFYLEPASPDYWLRIRRWETASRRLHDALPGDIEAGAFYALAHLATTPATVVSREHADRAAAILVRVLDRNPDHPGAMHYLVHANDVPGREHELMAITRRYQAVAPRNPHALHMPTHIYTRVGDWQAVIAGNRRAADAALEHPAGQHGELVWDEFPHAIEYLVYAWLQRGADDSAAAEVTRLHGTSRLEPTFKTAFHLASTRARYALERQAWAEAAALDLGTAEALVMRFGWPAAIVHFTRGVGAARSGRLDAARDAERELDRLNEASRSAGEDLFARNIRVLLLELRAWLAHAEGRSDAALASMREAGDLETSTPKHAVTPGPTIPAHEQLGDLLMAQKRPADALAAYERALALYPARFSSLLGAARAARASGNAGAAREHYRELLRLAGNGTRQVELDEARDHLGRAP